MRLLHLDASGRPVLTNFHGKPIPPYAILSHRWGDSELLFEDLGSEAYKEKKDGYQKLKFCAKQAAEDNLQYFWIDTCCIDKWNNRERSRAINSMFRWYRNATRCYVFLSDVLVPTATDTYQCNEWEASLRASEWFTRGWTLQELIAPASVEFFTCEGWRLGNKESLEQLVHEITGIPLAALRNCPLDQFTTCERMTWAKNRKTTEEEDSVYCLLGILDVAMPVSYREGRENALRRLQIEIEATGSAPSIIPFSQNDHFVGRESQLAELEAKLFGDKRTATTLAIIGPGGTGKSQLALELAYRTRQKNKNCSVFWIDANNVDSLDQSYASIAQKLDIPGWADAKADIKQLVKHRLGEECVRQCLLIFDNAENIGRGSSELAVAREVDLADYLPQSDLCSVVFTATDINTATWVAVQNVVELQELTPDAAKRMLDNYLDIPISASEQQPAILLLQEVSYLPLAIVQAAAYINTTGVALQQYQLLLERQNKHTLEHSGEPSEDKEQGRTTKNPVATTLFISIDEIQRSNTLAADYLFLTACVAQKDIPLDLLPAKKPRERENAVNIISRYALITRRPADSALDVHRLVHRALREWLQQRRQLCQWTQAAITQLYRVFPDDDHQSRSKWRRLLPHAKHALSYSRAGLDGGDRLNLLRKYANSLHSDGQYNEAEQLLVQVIETRKRVLGEEHPDTLISMNNLALIYQDQGRWKEAEELGLKVTELRKRLFGEEHPETLTSMNNLASIYWHKGQWKEAEELEVQVMETRKRVLGGEHPSTLISMHNLASTRGNQGRWKEAEKLEVQVIETQKRVLGEEHPNMLSSMNNLALIYLKQGPLRWKEAEKLEVQVMETRKRVLGEEHPETLTSMSNLALMYSKQGPLRWKEAEELEVQVMETRKRVLGEGHPSTLASMNNLALTLERQSRDVEAFSLMEACIQLSKQVLGDQHPHTKSSLRTLTEWQVRNVEVDP